jgi:hypothetical protein
LFWIIQRSDCLVPDHCGPFHKGRVTYFSLPPPNSQNGYKLLGQSSKRFSKAQSPNRSRDRKRKVKTEETEVSNARTRSRLTCRGFPLATFIFRSIAAIFLNNEPHIHQKAQLRGPILFGVNPLHGLAYSTRLLQIAMLYNCGTAQIWPPL